MNDQRISQRQALYLIFSTAFGTIIFLHSEIINESGRAAWLAETMATIILALPLALWTFYLARAIPGQTLIRILELTAGKFIGKLMGTLYVLISVVVTALMLISLSGLLKVFILPETPVWFTSMMVLILGAIIARDGIEVQGRLGEVLEPLLLGVFFLGVGMGFFSKLNVGYFVPIFDKGLAPLALGTYLTAGSVTEATLFLMVMVAVIPQSTKSLRMIIKSYLWVGFILGGAALAIIGTFSSERSALIAFGGVNVAVTIQFGEFIQGVEVFIIIAYILVVVLKVAAHTYAGWVTTIDMLRDWHPQVFLALIVIITATLSILLPSYNEAYFFSILLARYVTLPFTVLMLLITSVAIFLHTKRHGKVT